MFNSVVRNTLVLCLSLIGSTAQSQIALITLSPTEGANSQKVELLASTSKAQRIDISHLSGWSHCVVEKANLSVYGGTTPTRHFESKTQCVAKTQTMVEASCFVSGEKSSNNTVVLHPAKKGQEPPLLLAVECVN